MDHSHGLLRVSMSRNQWVGQWVSTLHGHRLACGYLMANIDFSKVRLGSIDPLLKSLDFHRRSSSLAPFRPLSEISCDIHYSLSNHARSKSKTDYWRPHHGRKSGPLAASSAWILRNPCKLGWHRMGAHSGGGCQACNHYGEQEGHHGATPGDKPSKISFSFPLDRVLSLSLLAFKNLLSCSGMPLRITSLEIGWGSNSKLIN